MNAKSSFLLVLTIASVCLFAGARQDQPAKPLQLPAENQDLIVRFEQLESRVQILEKILFSSVKLEETRAKRLLADRRNRLKNSRALYSRGMITDFELQQDRMQVDQAERELELAIADFKQNQLASKLDLAEAERKLVVAVDQLAHRRNMARRGYASKAEVEQLERALDEAKLELEHAKTKLNAASELDALKK